MANFAQFRYPADIPNDTFNKWMTFRVKAGRHILRTTTDVEASQPDEDLAAVHLYLPESALKSSLAVTWAESDLGPFAGKIIQEIAQTASNKGEITFAGMREIYGRAIKKGASLAAITDAAKEVFAHLPEGGTVELFKGTDSFFGEGTMQSLSGQKVNPRTDILFTTQQYRTFSFDFMMVPRDRAEAIAIDNIIECFQFYMLPVYKRENGSGGGMGYMMGVPYEFEISIHSGDGRRIRHVAQIGRSVLRNVTVDHAAGGKVAFVRDEELPGEAMVDSDRQEGVSEQVVAGIPGGGPTHFPVATLMSLEFQECRLLGRGDEEIQRGGHAFADPRR